VVRKFPLKRGKEVINADFEESAREIWGGSGL